MKRVFIFLCIVLFTASLSAEEKKVYFIGNSYTESNGMPAMVASAASSTGNTLTYAQQNPGGATLEFNTNSVFTYLFWTPNTFDYVIIQAHSQETSKREETVEVETFPYAKELCDSARSRYECSIPIFYMTWGRENGDADNCSTLPEVCTYEGMDSVINHNYRIMAARNNAWLSPVGYVWHYLRDNYPALDLYEEDESHPTVTGSYAAAITHYTMIFKRDPTLVTYNASLSGSDATIIKNAVKLLVFDNMSEWDFRGDSLSFETEKSPFTVSYKPVSRQKGTFYWEFGDGETQTDPAPVHIYDTAGTYEVTMKLIVCNDTVSYTQTVEVPDESTGIEDIETSVASIWPNPTTGKINIRLEDGYDDCKISVIDSNGKKVSSELLKNEKCIYEIDLPDAKGVYFVKVESGGKVSVHKVVKI